MDSWAGGHHLVNMGMHCANAVLLFLALRLMTGTLWPCVVVAALFAAHPLRVESVAWAAERKDVLCGLFWMASMLAYAFYARRRPLLQSSPPEAVRHVGHLPAGDPVLRPGPDGKVDGRHAALRASSSWTSGLWTAGGGPCGRPGAGCGPGSFRRLWLLLEKVPWFAWSPATASTVWWTGKGVALNSWEGLPWRPRVINARGQPRRLSRPDVLAGGHGPVLSPPAHVSQRLDGWTSTARFCDLRRSSSLVVTAAVALVLAEELSGGRLVLVPGHAGAGHRHHSGGHASQGRPLYLPAHDRRLPDDRLALERGGRPLAPVARGPGRRLRCWSFTALGGHLPAGQLLDQQLRAVRACR